MKRSGLITVAQMICFSLLGQEKFPVLTNVISFSELQIKTFERNFKWQNPDSSQEEIKILQMAIPNDEAMKQRTKEFVHSVYGLDSIWLNPRMIVFHAMGDGDLKTSLEVSSFLNDRIPESWGNLPKAGQLPNGAHFIIDRDGTIICLSPPLFKNGDQVSFERGDHRWLIKRQQDGNPLALGIENVTPQGNYTDLSGAQIESNAKLARWLIWFENGKVDYVASHHQFNDDSRYRHFLQSFHLQNLKMQFRTKGRMDIGEKNMTEILKRIRSFGIPVKNFFIPN